MARHLMAVCVVCLLCAEHLPCHQHVDASAALGAGVQSAASPNQSFGRGAGRRARAAAAAAADAAAAAALVAQPSIAAQRYVDTLHLPNAWREEDVDRSAATAPQTTAHSSRQKRHQAHDHEDPHDHDHDHESAAKSALPARTFVQRLFERFGNASGNGSDEHTMSVLGFERLLDQLGLQELLSGTQTEQQYRTTTAKTIKDIDDVDEGEPQCISSMDLVARVSSVHPPASHTAAPANTPSTAATAANATALAAEQAKIAAKEQLQLNARDFAAICPILVYQLTANETRDHRGCIDERLIAGDFAKRAPTTTATSGKAAGGQTEDRKLVWIYAMLAILIASLCGLLAVAVIPCMESDYYHYLLQFFVALGVGTLAGDALLHLFPHAMMTRSPGSDEHIDMTLKGLAAAGGVAFSFLMERGLTMVAEWRKRVEKKDKPSSRVRVMRDPDTVAQAANHNHNAHTSQHHHHHHHKHSGSAGAGDRPTPAQPLMQLQVHAHAHTTPAAAAAAPCSAQPAQSHPCNPHQPSGETVCKAKYSSYPYCYDEIDTDRCAQAADQQHHHHHQHHSNTDEPEDNASGGGPTAAVHSPKSPKSINNHNHHHHHHNNASNKVLYKTQPNGDDQRNDADADDDDDETAERLLPHRGDGGGCGDSAGADRMHRDLQLKPKNVNVENGGGGAAGGCDDNNSTAAMRNTTLVTEAHQLQLAGGKKQDTAAKHCDDLPEENYTIILREHEAKHHGHSHHHGHVHSPPSSMSAVAWMVIMGDGMHNFTDGMAIGAAFSYNIAGGFSTALAVFCHELPHELGDFAILLKAGMSARQAVYYNVLSSVLSFVGTVIGIWIGDTPQASAWVFAAAAGVFLYIAMVDMMPELTSSHKGTMAYAQLLLQMIGIMLGIGIMLTIALYEHDLKQIFSGGADDDGFGH